MTEPQAKSMPRQHASAGKQRCRAGSKGAGRHAAPSLAPVCVPHLVGQLVARVPACPLARRLGFVRRGRGGFAGRRAPVAVVLGLVPAVPVFGNSCPA